MTGSRRRAHVKCVPLFPLLLCIFQSSRECLYTGTILEHGRVSPVFFKVEIVYFFKMLLPWVLVRELKLKSRIGCKGWV
jgi:hypothetical protein